MIGAIYSALSGLIGFSTQIGVTAHNIAKASTDGFKRSRTEFVAVESGGVPAMIQKSETARPTSLYDRGYGTTQLELSNVDLVEKTVNRIVAQQGLEANLRALQTADGMLGRILDIKKLPSPPRDWKTRPQKECRIAICSFSMVCRAHG
jgi:flagellar hook protein FlgE